MKKPRYYVETWDTNTQSFSPQPGVRSGPYSLWGLRKALRKLRDMGYGITTRDGVSVLVYREGCR